MSGMTALIRKTICIRTSRGQLAVTHQIVRNHWNKDWQAGKYPTTREEREAAAKKYGLHPTEYEPYPDDGLGLGDYPKLPKTSGESKDPYYPWDFPEHKRNFNEPMHIDIDMIGEDRFNSSLRPRFNKWLQLGTFLAVMIGNWLIYRSADHLLVVPPVLPKQYPKPGETHYTFEPAE